MEARALGTRWFSFNFHKPGLRGLAMQHESNAETVPPTSSPCLHQRVIRYLGLGLMALSCLTTVSCVTISEEDAWVFSLSRAVYSSGDGDDKFGDADEHGNANNVGLLVLVALPLVLDIAFLPITVTHDCIVGDY